MINSSNLCYANNKKINVKRPQYYTIATFLLLYYCYLNNVRKIFIPGGSVTVLILLCVALFCVLIQSNNKLQFKKGSEAVMCFSWLLIALFILVNNTSLADNLISGGMVQLYVMIFFLICASASYKNWVSLWLNLTRFFVMVNAVATVVFYFVPTLFNIYANFMFSGDTLVSVLNNYSRGYMTGLCGHFSTNGMILGIGSLFWIETFLYQLRVKKEVSFKKKLITAICVLTTFYAVILTSKRAVFLAVLLSVAIVFIVYRQKNIFKRIFILLGVCVLLYLAYILLANYIPGLSTIIDKFMNLSESDAGILNGRSGLWERAITMFNESPIFGNGYGSYSDYATETDAITTSAHNYYLQILAEFGIVGLILYVLAFISGIIFCLKKLIQASKVRDLRLVLYLSIALEVQLFVMIYNMTATALMYYYILIPYLMACTVPRVITVNKK